jgi:hypothetical protein
MVAKWKHAALLSDVGKSNSGTTATTHAKRAAIVQCSNEASSWLLFVENTLLLLV